MPETTTTVAAEPEPVTSSFIDIVHAEKDVVDVPTLFHKADSDLWLWDYLVAGYAPLMTKTFTVETPGALAGIELSVSLQGLVTTEVTGEHHVLVKLNGTELGETSWTGAVPHSATFSIPAGVLTEGANQVEVTALLDNGVAYSLVAVDSLDLTYERALATVGDQLLFTLTAAGTARVGGLTSADAWIFDLADPLLPRALSASGTGDDGGSAWVEFSGELSDYLVATTSSALRPQGHHRRGGSEAACRRQGRGLRGDNFAEPGGGRRAPGQLSGEGWTPYRGGHHQ